MIHRVARAVVNNGFQWPSDRVVINVAPAELRKQAASIDLPISLGIMAAIGQFQSDRFLQYAATYERGAVAACSRRCQPAGNRSPCLRKRRSRDSDSQSDSRRGLEKTRIERKSIPFDTQLDFQPRCRRVRG
ncbi:MAG: magnesium chelatase domain-containing protein [Pirellulaceae bacterium]